MKISQLMHHLVECLIVHGDTEINVKVSQRDEFGNVVNYKNIPISYILYTENKPVIAIEQDTLDNSKWLKN